MTAPVSRSSATRTGAATKRPPRLLATTAIAGSAAYAPNFLGRIVLVVEVRGEVVLIIEVVLVIEVVVEVIFIQVVEALVEVVYAVVVVVMLVYGVVVVVVILVVVVLIVLVVHGVAVRKVRVGSMIVRILLFRADTKLSPQLVKIHASAAVLELAGNLYLLGLGSAAPHWLDPLERTGARSGPHVTALIVCPQRADACGLSRTAEPPAASPPLGAQRARSSVHRQRYLVWAVGASGHCGRAVTSYPGGLRNRVPGASRHRARPHRQLLPSQMPRKRPTSDIRRSASRSAATTGGTSSSEAMTRIFLVVSKICAAFALARSKLKPASSSATWITPPEFTT